LNKDSWEFAPRRGHGAMYGGIHSLQKTWDILYIGWTGLINNITKEPAQNLKKSDKTTLYNQLEKKYSCIPLFVDSENVAGHYDGYCKTSKVEYMYIIIIYFNE
jgi:trehalose-6-phosphate synthase